ncbi:MAG: hypothetical protein KY455_04030 [Euryarchaeota archaeon]|nr:hypothetical protein [Euryarchaeota archaeon]
MLSRAFLVVVTLLAISLSGCISDEGGPASDAETVTDTAAEILARLQGDAAALGCEPSYTKGETSPIFREIGTFDTAEIRYGEADVVHGTDFVVFARYGGGGFDILNVSNPYDPEHVVGFPIPVETSYTLDIKSSRDGKTLFSGGRGSITIIDISNVTDPVIEKTVALPYEAAATRAQAHMIHVAEIGGEQYLFVASQWGHGVLIFKLLGEPGARDLKFLTYFAPAIGGPIAAHDMMVMHDPVEQVPILWVANGIGGFIAADVTDPANPSIVSYTPEADPYQGYTHTVSVTFYGDKRIAATMAELGAMALKVYDVTDLATPILLGTWTISPVPDQTQHNTQIIGDWLFIGHYQHGVLQFNLSAYVADPGALPAYNLGALSPVIGGMEPFAQYLPNDSTSTWETIIVNGVHYTTAGGIRVALNGCLDAGEKEARAYV